MGKRVITAREQYEMAEPFLRQATPRMAVPHLAEDAPPPPGTIPSKAVKKVVKKAPVKKAPPPADDFEWEQELLAQEPELAPAPQFKNPFQELIDSKEDPGHFHPDFKKFMDVGVNSSGGYEESSWDDYHQSPESAQWWHDQFNSYPSNQGKKPVQHPDFVQWMDDTQGKGGWGDYHEGDAAEGYHQLYEEQNTPLPEQYAKNSSILNLLQGFNGGDLNFGQAAKAVNKVIETSPYISDHYMNPEGIKHLKHMLGDNYPDFVDLLDKKNYSKLTGDSKYYPLTGEPVSPGGTGEDIGAIQKLLGPVNQGTPAGPTGAQIAQDLLDMPGSNWDESSEGIINLKKLTGQEAKAKLEEWMTAYPGSSGSYLPVYNKHFGESDIKPPSQPGFNASVLAKDLGSLFKMDPDKIKIKGSPVKDMSPEEAEAGLQGLIDIHDDKKDLQDLYDLHFGESGPPSQSQGTPVEEPLAVWEKDLLGIANIPDWALQGAHVHSGILDYLSGKGLGALDYGALFDPKNADHIAALNNVTAEGWDNIKKHYQEDTGESLGGSADPAPVTSPAKPQKGLGTLLSEAGLGYAKQGWNNYAADNPEEARKMLKKHWMADIHSGNEAKRNKALKIKKVYDQYFFGTEDAAQSAPGHPTEQDLVGAGIDSFWAKKLAEWTPEELAKTVQDWKKIKQENPNMWDDTSIAGKVLKFLDGQQGGSQAPGPYVPSSKNSLLGHTPAWLGPGKNAGGGTYQTFPGIDAWLQSKGITIDQVNGWKSPSGGGGWPDVVNDLKDEWKGMSPDEKAKWADYELGGAHPTGSVKSAMDYMPKNDAEWEQFFGVLADSLGMPDIPPSARAGWKDGDSWASNFSSSIAHPKAMAAWRKLHDSGQAQSQVSTGPSQGLQNFFEAHPDDFTYLEDDPHFRNWFNKNHSDWNENDGQDAWEIHNDYTHPWDSHSPQWFNNSPYSDDALERFSDWQDEIGPDQLHEWDSRPDDGGWKAEESFNEYLKGKGVHVHDHFDRAMEGAGLEPQYYGDWKETLSPETRDYFQANPQAGYDDYFGWSNYENGYSWQYESQAPDGEWHVNYLSMGLGDAPDDLKTLYGHTFADGVGAYLLSKYPSLRSDEDIESLDSWEWDQILKGWNSLSGDDKEKYYSVENQGLHPKSKGSAQYMMSSHQKMVTSPEFKAWFSHDNSGADLDHPSHSSAAQMLFDEPDNPWTQQKVNGFKKYLEVKNDPDFQKFLKDEGYGTSFNLGNPNVDSYEWKKQVNKWNEENDRPAPFNAHAVTKALKKIDPDFWSESEKSVPMANYPYLWHKKNLENLIAQGENGDFPPEETAGYKKLYQKYFGEPIDDTPVTLVPKSDTIPRSIQDGFGEFTPEFQSWLWDNKDKNLTAQEFSDKVQSWNLSQWNQVARDFQKSQPGNPGDLAELSPPELDEEDILNQLSTADSAYWDNGLQQGLRNMQKTPHQWREYLKSYATNGNYPPEETEIYRGLLDKYFPGALEDQSVPVPGMESSSSTPALRKPSERERAVKGQITNLIDKIRALESKTTYDADDLSVAQSPDFQRWFAELPSDYRQVVQQFPYIALDDYANGGEASWVPESDGEDPQIYNPYTFLRSKSPGGKIELPNGDTYRLPGYENTRHWPGHTLNPKAPDHHGRPDVELVNRPPDVPGQLEIPLGGGSSWEPDKKWPTLRRGINLKFNRYKPGERDHKLLSLPGIEGEQHRRAAQLLDEIKELVVGSKPIHSSDTYIPPEGTDWDPGKTWTKPWTLFDGDGYVDNEPEVPVLSTDYNNKYYNSDHIDKWLNLMKWATDNSVPPEQMWEIAKRAGHDNPDQFGTPPQSYFIEQSKHNPKAMAKEISRLTGDDFYTDNLQDVSRRLQRIERGGYSGDEYDSETRRKAGDLYDRWFGRGLFTDLLAHKIAECLETGAWKSSEFVDHPHPGGMGPHWTDKDEDDLDFGDTDDDENAPSDTSIPVQVVMEWPGFGEDKDSKDGAAGFEREREITLNPGAPFRLKQLLMRHPYHPDPNKRLVYNFDTPQWRHASAPVVIPVRKQGRSVLSHRERFAYNDDPYADFDSLENPMDSGRADVSAQPRMTPEDHLRYQHHRTQSDGRILFPSNGLNPPSDAVSRPDIRWQYRDPEQPKLDDSMPQDRVPQSLFRGLAVNLKHPSAAGLHRIVFGHHPDDEHLFDINHQAQPNWNHPQLGHALLDHLEHGWARNDGPHPIYGMGAHWSIDPSEANGFAMSEAMHALRDPNGLYLPVRLHGDWRGLGEDPYRSGTGESHQGEFADENEMTLLPGAGMNIRNVQIRPPLGRGYDNWKSILDTPQFRHAATPPISQRPRNAKRILSQRELLEDYL